MATPLISLSGSELRDMYLGGDPSGLAELERRHAKNGRASTAKFIEECIGTAPKEATPTPTVDCVENASESDLVALLLQLLGQSPTPAKAKAKPKAKAKAVRENRLPTGPVGVNVITEVGNDGAWITYSPGVGDRNGNISEFADEFAYIGDLMGEGATATEARKAFYAGLTHYLPRPFRVTHDNRNTKAKASVAKPKANVMTRAELKDALGLPSSDKTRTATLETLYAEMLGVEDMAPKPVPTKPKAVTVEALLKTLANGNMHVG